MPEVTAAVERQSCFEPRCLPSRGGCLPVGPAMHCHAVTRCPLSHHSGSLHAGILPEVNKSQCRPDRERHILGEETQSKQRQMKWAGFHANTLSVYDDGDLALGCEERLHCLQEATAVD